MPSLPQTTVHLADPQRVPLIRSRRGDHRDPMGTVWELSWDTPTLVYERPVTVVYLPSSLMSCPSSDYRRTVELSLGRSCSHNVHFQSSLVPLLLPGLTEETESDLALGVQCQAVCTSPGRSSVPNKDKQVWGERRECEEGEKSRLAGERGGKGTAKERRCSLRH